MNSYWRCLRSIPLAIDELKISIFCLSSINLGLELRSNEWTVRRLNF